MSDGSADAPDPTINTGDNAGDTADAGGVADMPAPPPPPAMPTVLGGVHGSGEPWNPGSPRPEFGNPKIHIST